MFSCVYFIDDEYTAKDVYVCESSSSVYFCYLCAASRYICLSGRLGPCVCQDVPSFGNSLSRCSIFRQVTLSSLCVYVCMCVCVSGRLGPRVCQDGPSFGNSLSRCSIFRQVTLLSCVCVCVCICVCVWAFGSLCMSGCSILRQQPLKVFHLSSGDPFVLCVCICVCVWAFGSLCMSGCSILWQQPVKMFHLSSGDPFVLCVCMCVCVSGRLGPCVMSGCSILRQQPLKMFHLSSGDPFVLCVCMCVYVCLGVWVLVYVRMLHPLATACQDVPSFVR